MGSRVRPFLRLIFFETAQRFSVKFDIEAFTPNLSAEFNFVSNQNS
jgi:hypothetical protein